MRVLLKESHTVYLWEIKTTEIMVERDLNMQRDSELMYLIVECRHYWESHTGLLESTNDNISDITKASITLFKDSIIDVDQFR